MRVNLNPFTVEAWGRVYGTKTFITALDIAIPEAQLHAERALGVFSSEQLLDDSEYSNERQMLEEQYRYWVPRYASYAGVILLHSTVETLIFGCADWVRRSKSIDPVKKPRGECWIGRGGLSKRSAALMWPRTMLGPTLFVWKNSEVSSCTEAGTLEMLKPIGTWERLKAAYPGKVWVVDRSDLHIAYIVVSPVLCTEFGDLIEGFFKRVLKRVAA